MSKLFFESTKIDVYPAGFRSQEFIKSKITSESNLTEISKQLNNTIALKGLNYIVKLDGYVFTFDVSDLRTLLDAQTGEVYCTIAYRELSDVGNVLAPILDNNDETVVCLDVGGEFKGLAIEVGEHSGDLVTEGSDTSRRSLLIGKFESNTFTPYFSLHLGQNTFSKGKNTISEGYYANTSGDDSISIGNNASVIGNSAIALGNNAKVSADEAVQIGEGENTQANSIKFGDKTINQDLIPSINNTSKLGNNSNTWNEVNTYDCNVFNDLEIDHDLSVTNSASITHNLSSDNSATNNLKVNKVVESNLNPDATANNRVLGNNSNIWKEAYISNVHGTSDKALNDDRGNAILSNYAHSLSTGNASQGKDNTLQLKDGQATAETLSTVTISNVASANFAKKANVSQTSTDGTNSVAFNIGGGTGFSQTVNNVSNASYAAHIGTDSSHPAIGGTNYPVYVNSSGEVVNSSTKYAGGSAVKLNGTYDSDPTIYANISGGTAKQILVSNGSGQIPLYKTVVANGSGTNTVGIKIGDDVYEATVNNVSSSNYSKDVAYSEDIIIPDNKVKFTVGNHTYNRTINNVNNANYSDNIEITNPDGSSAGYKKIIIIDSANNAGVQSYDSSGIYFVY